VPRILAVLTQTQTVSGAARSLNLARNHFQTIFHRVLASMIEAMTPKPAGRPGKPAREAELEAENAKLRQENEALRIRTEAIERMLTVVGGIAVGSLLAGRDCLDLSRNREARRRSRRTPSQRGSGRRQ
jgi:hypothetical protein